MRSKLCRRRRARTSFPGGFWHKPLAGLLARRAGSGGARSLPIRRQWLCILAL